MLFCVEPHFLGVDIFNKFLTPLNLLLVCPCECENEEEAERAARMKNARDGWIPVDEKSSASLVLSTVNKSAVGDGF